MAKKRQKRRKTLPERIPAILVELRGRHDLSQRAAAIKCGFELNRWNRWETGARSPAFSDLEKIAKVFGTTVDLVFRT